MKKLLTLTLLVLTFCCQSVLADEIMANQDVKVEKNKAVLKVQKQPASPSSQQKASVKNNWFCVVVQVNGKADGINRAVSDTKQ